MIIDRSFLATAAFFERSSFLALEISNFAFTHDIASCVDHRRVTNLIRLPRLPGMTWVDTTNLRIDLVPNLATRASYCEGSKICRLVGGALPWPLLGMVLPRLPAGGGVPLA